MATATPVYQADCIGEAAGLVWQYLDEFGPVTLSRMAREINVPRDLVMQGLGWLAREGKIEFIEGSRSKMVSLVQL